MVNIPMHCPAQLHPINASRRGLTLVEIIIVLTIFGLIIGGIWASVANSVSNNRSKRLVEQVIVTSENMRDYLRKVTTPPTGTADVQTTALRDMGIFPADMIKTAGVRNSYGGAVTLFYSQTNANGNITTAFEMANANLPRAACMDMIIKLVSTDDSVFARSANNGNTLVTTGNAASASSACTNAVNTVTLVFPVS